MSFPVKESHPPTRPSDAWQLFCSGDLIAEAKEKIINPIKQEKWK